VDNKKYIAIPGGWGSDHSITGKTVSHEVLMRKKGEFESGCLWNFPFHMLKIRFLNIQNSHVLGQLMLPISIGFELTDCIYLYLNFSAFWNFFSIYFVMFNLI
jgi:hypothetical protein